MTDTTAKPQIVLPALRGVMGTWVYYSCLMQLSDVGSRISYAEEVHSNEHLSDMIQRQLNRGRSKDIAQYLKDQPERFFNSLVVAAYEGEPNWHSLGELNFHASEIDPSLFREETVESVGFLTLRGDEKIFAVDGQHRLAGIKRVIKESSAKGKDTEAQASDDDILQDLVSVIFVSHNPNELGLERTRRLFTTLNKTARPVSKGDIIALDEDDAMAITVRRLIETTALFENNRVAFTASNNMPTTNTTSLTTIGLLYDVLAILFSKHDFELRASKAKLKRIRPPDDELDTYFDLAKRYFDSLAQHFPALTSFFDADDTTEAVQTHRGNHGGHILYRPIGLAIFTEIIMKLAENDTLENAIQRAARLPTALNSPPYEGLLWSSGTQTILSGNNVTLREVLLFQLGISKLSDEVLLERYQASVGDLALPEKV